MTGFGNMSPGLDRVGRACAWIEHEGRVLMSARDSSGWTLPGGGIHSGETPEQAAVRETYEECGAHVEIIGAGVRLAGGAMCYPARLRDLESSPEGRPRLWVNPRTLWWACDPQLWQVLAARGEQVPPPPLRSVLKRVRRSVFTVQAAVGRRGGF